MPTLNFVAVEEGLEDDPKLLSLARALKVARPIAFWFVVRWRRLILLRGNHLTGTLPKNYSPADIASFLEFTGRAAALVDALKRQGYVAHKKGRGFCDPDWRTSITGRYAFRREDDRLWHDRERKKKRGDGSRQSDDVVRPSADASGDVVTTSARDLTERKKEREPEGAERPPGPPPGGGGHVADARWAWLLENAPVPRKSEVCRRLLEALSEEDWTLVQSAYSRLAPGASIALSKRERAWLRWPTSRFLSEEAYLAFRVRRPSKTVSKPRSGGTNNGAAVLKELEAQAAAADAFVMNLLADPEQDVAAKVRARERWLAHPANNGRNPPWIGSATTNGAADAAAN